MLRFDVLRRDVFAETGEGALWPGVFHGGRHGLDRPVGVQAWSRVRSSLSRAVVR